MFESGPLLKVLWKDHASIMASNFLKLLQYEEFADVHICHAGRTIMAHRTLLAASSELFRARLGSPAAAVTAVDLSSLPCVAGLLHGRGPDLVFAELGLIIQIVYRGWVDLRERSIGSLMETARCFQFSNVTEVLQRTIQARASAQPTQQLPHHPSLQHQLQLQQPQPLQTPLSPQSAVPGPAESLDQLAVGELSLRALQEAMEPSCLLAPELADLTHLTPLVPMAVERRPDSPPSLPPPQPPPDCGLRHEDAAGLTAAGLCEVVHHPPPLVELTNESPVPPPPPLPDVSAPDGLADDVIELTEHDHSQQLGQQEHQQDHQQVQQQEQERVQEQERPPGPQDGAPLLRVRTQFELHCPWGLDMAQAGREQHEPEQGKSC